MTLERQHRTIEHTVCVCLLALVLLVTGCAPLAAPPTLPEKQPLPEIHGLAVAVDGPGALLLQACQSGAEGTLLLDLYETAPEDAAALVMTGEAEFAIVDVPADSSLELDEGFGSAVLAQDVLVLVASSHSAISELDIRSLQGIYSGNVLDWSELNLGQGVPEALLQSDAARASLWQQGVLGGGSPGSSCVVVPDDRAVIEYVRGHVGAIGYCSASLALASEGLRVVDIAGLPSGESSSNESVMAMNVTLMAPSDLTGDGRVLADWLLSTSSSSAIDSCFSTP